LITSPTRVTENTSTILDHVLTNSQDRVSQSGVIDIGLSDHQLTYCTRKIIRPKVYEHNYNYLIIKKLFTGCFSRCLKGDQFSSLP